MIEYNGILYVSEVQMWEIKKNHNVPATIHNTWFDFLTKEKVTFYNFLEYNPGANPNYPNPKYSEQKKFQEEFYNNNPQIPLNSKSFTQHSKTVDLRFTQPNYDLFIKKYIRGQLFGFSMEGAIFKDGTVVIFGDYGGPPETVYRNPKQLIEETKLNVSRIEDLLKSK
jgi:hypothetical protein